MKRQYASRFTSYNNITQLPGAAKILKSLQASTGMSDAEFSKIVQGATNYVSAQEERTHARRARKALETPERRNLRIRRAVLESKIRSRRMRIARLESRIARLQKIVEDNEGNVPRKTLREELKAALNLTVEAWGFNNSLLELHGLPELPKLGLGSEGKRFMASVKGRSPRRWAEIAVALVVTILLLIQTVTVLRQAEGKAAKADVSGDTVISEAQAFADATIRCTERLSSLGVADSGYSLDSRSIYVSSGNATFLTNLVEGCDNVDTNTLNLMLLARDLPFNSVLELDNLTLKLRMPGDFVPGVPVDKTGAITDITDIEQLLNTHSFFNRLKNEYKNVKSYAFARTFGGSSTSRVILLELAKQPLNEVNSTMKWVDFGNKIHIQLRQPESAYPLVEKLVALNVSAARLIEQPNKKLQLNIAFPNSEYSWEGNATDVASTLDSIVHFHKTNGARLNYDGTPFRVSWANDTCCALMAEDLTHNFKLQLSNCNYTRDWRSQKYVEYYTRILNSIVRPNGTLVSLPEAVAARNLSGIHFILDEKNMDLGYSEVEQIDSSIQMNWFEPLSKIAGKTGRFEIRRGPKLWEVKYVPAAPDEKVFNTPQLNTALALAMLADIESVKGATTEAILLKDGSKISFKSAFQNTDIPLFRMLAIHKLGGSVYRWYHSEYAPLVENVKTGSRKITLPDGSEHHFHYVTYYTDTFSGEYKLMEEIAGELEEILEIVHANKHIKNYTTEWHEGRGGGKTLVLRVTLDNGTAGSFVYTRLTDEVRSQIKSTLKALHAGQPIGEASFSSAEPLTLKTGDSFEVNGVLAKLISVQDENPPRAIFEFKQKGKHITSQLMKPGQPVYIDKTRFMVSTTQATATGATATLLID